MIRLALWLLGGVLLGGIVHLATVLWLPELATQDAYSRLVAGRAGQCGDARSPPPTPDKSVRAVPGSGLCDGGVPLRPRATGR